MCSTDLQILHNVQHSTTLPQILRVIQELKYPPYYIVESATLRQCEHASSGRMVAKKCCCGCTSVKFPWQFRPACRYVFSEWVHGFERL